MVRAVAVRQLGRLGLRRLELLSGATPNDGCDCLLYDSRIRKSETVKLQRLGKEVWVVHHRLDGGAGPVAHVELGAVRQGEGP